MMGRLAGWLEERVVTWQCILVIRAQLRIKYRYVTLPAGAVFSFVLLYPYYMYKISFRV